MSERRQIWKPVELDPAALGTLASTRLANFCAQWNETREEMEAKRPDYYKAYRERLIRRSCTGVSGKNAKSFVPAEICG